MSLKQIRIKREAQGTYEPALLIDENHAICSDPERSGFAYLFTVKPLSEPDTYVSAKKYNHIIVGRSVRNNDGLVAVVEKLRSISAYDLLTQYYDSREESFIVNNRNAR